MKDKMSNATTVLRDVGPEIAKPGMQVFLLICIFFFILSFFLQKILAPWSFLVMMVAVLWYVLFKDVLTEHERTVLKRWLKAVIFLACCGVALVPYVFLGRLLGGLTATSALIAFFCAGTAIGLLVLGFHSEAGKKCWEWLDTGFNSVLAGGSKGLKPGDVVLCDNKELVDKGAKDCREIIPYKDRFLHMLILGPTGGGKTSQVILPMCYQDVHNLEAGITVLEPKGDLARQVAMMAKDAGRDYIYFDPSVDNCPFFNPLVGDESDVIENAVTTFLMLNPDSPQFFKDLSEQLVRNSLKVLKRLDKAEGVDGKYSTFIWMSRVLQNNGGQGRELVRQFSNLTTGGVDEIKENQDIASWFLNEYFAERSKVYENSSGIRSQVSKVIANRYLRKILNPDFSQGEFNQIDFDKHLADGGVICISTSQGMLRDLGKFLGYFLILQLQSAVFRRPGNEDNRRAHFLYIDEFQTYSTPGFSDMLTQGRSYRVASHLATQARAQMAMGGGRDGKNFVELVSTNARNIVIFPGGSKDDAKFYSEQFGEYEKEEVSKSYSRKTFNPIMGGFDRLGHPSEGERYQMKMTANFSPTDIIYRPFGEIIYCIIKNNSIQTPKVGKVKWLDKEYDTRMKKMIEDEIVIHEWRSQERVNGQVVAEECVFDEAETTFESLGKQEPATNTPPAAPVSAPAPAPVVKDLGADLGEEIFFDSDTPKAANEPSAQEEAAMHALPGEEDWIHEDSAMGYDIDTPSGGKEDSIDPNPFESDFLI